MLSRLASHIFVRSYVKTLTASFPPQVAKSISQTVLDRVPNTVTQELSSQEKDETTTTTTTESQRLWLTMCASVLHADEAMTEYCNKQRRQQPSSSSSPETTANQNNTDDGIICSTNPATRQRLLAQALMDIPLAKYYNSKMGFFASMVGNTTEAQLQGFFSQRIAQLSQRLFWWND